MQRDWFMHHLGSNDKNRLKFPFKYEDVARTQISAVRIYEECQCTTNHVCSSDKICPSEYKRPDKEIISVLTCEYNTRAVCIVSTNYQKPLERWEFEIRPHAKNVAVETRNYLRRTELLTRNST